MDIEILQILKSIQGDVKSMQGDIKTMQGDIRSMQGDINSMQGDIKSMKADITEANHRIGSLEKKTDKNTLLLEDLNKKVQIVGEVQFSLTEQLDRAKDKDGRSLSDRFNVIELAVTDTSPRVKDMQKDLTRVIRATGENWAEIAELKAVK
ncbi:chromosome partition protein Smc [Clostridium homopropionicum DSM 5847]|uniref:Chromosome partition protein Smc n=1 Tax=Clostridium homopropionicum DSM 5847 TaxID=1121318 RepID=A0A0L6ZF01_9CLOT|nr:hypothetical protein [Clostridium homopropionicum]KOA21551.1 chromosome partition protein Smc [Clostridium homopropionicum DSM 5847]SFH00234.1 hypothetical protein SAMN04488501_13313 [Clostridium homopropionicum]